MPTMPKAITFDCYGTLIDWEEEIQYHFGRLLQSRNIQGIDAQALQRRWEEIQFAYIQEYHPYHQVLRETMTETFREYGLPLGGEEAETFARSMGKWRAFPDTQSSLEVMQRELGIKVVLITNTDDKIIAETVSQLGVMPDEIITAEQAGAYKPHHEGFLLARQRLQLPVEEIWHAGFGFKYDIVPATELGYTTVWVNRQGEARPAGITVKETFLVGDLATLVYLLKGIKDSPTA
jgi:2-haloacid dehalogenase